MINVGVLKYALTLQTPKIGISDPPPDAAVASKIS